ncbi:zinc finger protein 11 [Culex quinquefasciatus]|uniref:zinc finger protein 11 n=1 Tax=Culex quinquefasciatus TaxID=7176 RepID=UPI0018E3EC56|nr:zinc finger protein 11 [Culex quinquefasciatus]
MDNVESICRICLTGSAGDIDRLLIDIFPREKEGSEPEFPVLEAFHTICGVEVQQDDLMPKQLCSICFSKLEQAFSLRQQSQKSHETLSNILTKAVGSGQYEEDGDEDRLYEVEYLLEEQESVELESEVKIEQAELQAAEVVCCGCDDSFASENELRRHAGRRHRPKVLVTGIPAGRRQCNICFEVFDEAGFVAHREGRNNVQPLNACKFCGCKFASRNGLANHQLKFHGDNRYRCCGCDFSSLRLSELKAHAKDHEREFIFNGRLTEGKKYSCKLCFAQFGTVALKRHHERFPYRKLKSKQPRQTDEVTVSILRCCGCPKIYPTYPELRAHQQEIHLPQRPNNPDLAMMVECAGCYRQFRNKAYLNRHLRQAAEKKLFACGKCSVTRRTLKELMEHEATHTGGEAFVCCGCREGFASKEELERHSKEVHARRPKVYLNDEESTERPFECGVCYRRYKSARDLRGHQRFVYYEKVHICETCGKGFAQENSLAVHLATHKSHPEFPCPTCGKKYKHESNVRNCVARHERPKQHRCKICNVTFPAASNLYSHMVSHSEERRFKCDVCGMTFKRSFHLRKHQNTHTSVRNFACRHCPSRFSTTTELYKHEIRHTGQYPYQCGVCRKQLTTRQVFIKHVESHVADGDKVHRCELCPARYSQDHFLSNHVKYTHRLEPQDKSWNEKFNRRGPSNRMKGGVRIAGVLLGGGGGPGIVEQGEEEQGEGDTYELLIDEQMEGMEEIAVELEIRDE